jgi:hypothetical protein
MYALDIIEALKRTGKWFQWPCPVEILLVGGAAGMTTGLFDASRNTLDCDVMCCVPSEATNAIIEAATQVGQEMGISTTWLNTQVRQLNILPDGWHTRRQKVGDFGKLHVFSAGRLDLLAMKFYANRTIDREDVAMMKPRPDELAFVQTYLNMLRVPSREADLDQVTAALRRVRAMLAEVEHG